uniref:Uncharacterized protein n=1 Tax=Romanomermis culicivorax TaxID=13658 RepID=A0A915I4R8_ROMCU
MNIYNSVGSYGDDKQELSLVEKKKLQWSQEKADQNEWFPFGKKNDYRSRKSSQIVNNNNESTPALENKNLTTVATTKTAIKTTKGQIISPSLQQTQDINGIGSGSALLSQNAAHYALASQPIDKVIHVHIGKSAPNAFVPSQPSSSSITTTMPVVNLNKGSPLLVGEQFSSVIAALNLDHQQPILIHQTPFVKQNIGQSPTNSSYSPSNFYGFRAGYVDSINAKYQHDVQLFLLTGTLMFSVNIDLSIMELLLADILFCCLPTFYFGNDSLVRIQQNPHEYTEDWANQLNYWQTLQSPDDNVTNFIIDNLNQKILSMREENRLIAAAAASQHPSTFVCSTPVQQQNFHQPDAAYALNPPLPMAYVSPLIFNSETQRTAPVTSPLASKPSSISGQKFAESVYQDFNCFAPHKISGLDDSVGYEKQFNRELEV